jgi:uncharacterized protein (TIGR00290 family)
MKKVVLSWSGGKDSVLSLRELKRHGEYEVVTLLTTITEGYDRISMHGVRTLLLEKQAELLGIRLHKVYIPKDANNETYEKSMIEALAMYPAMDVKEIAFGDVYLEDVKAYREKLIGRTQLKSVYPIWKRDTKELITEFIGEGYKAITVCIDTKKLPESFLGRELDKDFIKELPANVDPSGENGEYHTFVYDGPDFREPVKFELGEKVRRGEFGFVDLVDNCI